MLSTLRLVSINSFFDVFLLTLSTFYAFLFSAVFGGNDSVSYGVVDKTKKKKKKPEVAPRGECSNMH